MKTHHKTPGNPPFGSDRGSSSESPTFLDSPEGAPGIAIRHGRHSLPAGWRKLSTGLRGAWLYAVRLHNGGVYWLVEVMRDGAELSRRFASELQARAWLRELLLPGFAPPPVDWEEMNEPLRLALREPDEN